MNIELQLQRHKGFTLIELAVVLVIIGILLSGFIGTFASRIESTRKSETIEELNEIKLAMVAYAFVSGALPCPDCARVGGNCFAAVVGDGISDFIGGGACAVGADAGNAPWVTIGLGQSDAWGTRYRYAVQSEYANTTVPFKLDSPAGTGTIQEPDFVADATGATRHSLANNVVAIIFSHGKNGLGGIGENGLSKASIPVANIDEKENTDNDAVYYMRPESAPGAAIAGGEFDDYVIWISEYELKAKMVAAGKLP